MNSLAHLIDVPALKRAYCRQRSDAAVGVDGVSTEQYGRNLEANLEDLHARLKDKRYRHQAIRRVHIPKAPGKTRPELEAGRGPYPRVQQRHSMVQGCPHGIAVIR